MLDYTCNFRAISDGVDTTLKYEKQAVLSPEDCDRFVEQTLSHVVGTGKRIGLLTVLDNSPKAAALFPLKMECAS